uniref:Traf and tnf receptor associated protein n=1 Tax=Echinococcus granulosus TaxID=6210 RepID=A0A068WF08_ECHGR|nr:traf and tnf receptor associated protein [Echinococcus granulosus]
MDVDSPDDLPSEDECFKRCELFSQLTNTNNALAMMFLQQVSWNLEAAVERPQPQSWSSAPVIDLTSDSDELVVAKEGEETEEVVDKQHAHLFRLLSWNIDGLSVQSRDFRTPAVVALIRSEKFHVVCLQEVVKESLAYIKEQLTSLYEVFHPQDVQRRDYFPIICILKHSGLSILPDTFKVIPFPGSTMQRILLSVDVVLDVPHLLRTNPRARQWEQIPLRVRLWTSHLESCNQFAEERMHQLKRAWGAMQAAIHPGSSSANGPLCGILCGDLNIRDKEIEELGGLPQGMVDVWEMCGARPEAKATWDPRRNPNLQLDHPQSNGPHSRPPAYGMRFDRLHVLGGGLRPVDFELRGLERVPGRSHFPSDHWAILGHFDFAPPPT